MGRKKHTVIKYMKATAETLIVGLLLLRHLPFLLAALAGAVYLREPKAKNRFVKKRR